MLVTTLLRPRTYTTLTASAGIRWIRENERGQGDGERKGDREMGRRGDGGKKAKRLRGPASAFSPSPRLPVSPSSSAPLVAVVMGSKSEWETMRHAEQTMNDFG